MMNASGTAPWVALAANPRIAKIPAPTIPPIPIDAADTTPISGALLFLAMPNPIAPRLAESKSSSAQLMCSEVRACETERHRMRLGFV